VPEAVARSRGGGAEGKATQIVQVRGNLEALLRVGYAGAEMEAEM
jgi:hypothetical protein